MKDTQQPHVFSIEPKDIIRYHQYTDDTEPQTVDGLTQQFHIEFEMVGRENRTFQQSTKAWRTIFPLSTNTEEADPREKTRSTVKWCPKSPIHRSGLGYYGQPIEMKLKTKRSRSTRMDHHCYLGTTTEQK